MGHPSRASMMSRRNAPYLGPWNETQPLSCMFSIVNATPSQGAIPTKIVGVLMSTCHFSSIVTVTTRKMAETFEEMLIKNGKIHWLRHGCRPCFFCFLRIKCLSLWSWPFLFTLAKSKEQTKDDLCFWWIWYLILQTDMKYASNKYVSSTACAAMSYNPGCKVFYDSDNLDGTIIAGQNKNMYVTPVTSWW